MKRIVDEKRALSLVMDLLKIEGPSGGEKKVARRLTAELVKAGVPRRSIRFDGAAKRTGGEVGNLIAEVPGRGELAGAKRRLFAAHMDTVATAVGARPLRRGNRIVPKGDTALGADNRAGVCAILSMIRTLHGRKLPHPPLVLLFTVSEEAGLLGARQAQKSLLKKCAMGFNYDGSDPAEFVIGAPSYDELVVEVTGVAAHAGQNPRKGVSAAVVFAKAVSELEKNGWLGKIKKARRQATSNIGLVEGGVANNIVMPNLRAKCEIRCYNDYFLDRVEYAFRRAFGGAAKGTRNAEGRRARVSLKEKRIFNTFSLSPGSEAVRVALEAARSLGLEGKLTAIFGGLDANWFNAAGLPTVTLGGGGRNAHSTSEYLDVRQYLNACEMAVRLSGAELG